MRNLRHTQKQNRTTHHTNKKTLLKIQTQTKQTRKTTQKINFYYLFIEIMATLQQTYKKHAIGRAPKGTKRGLYAFLGGFKFEDQREIQDAILQFCKIKDPSYAELIRADEVADEYIAKRKLENIYILPF